MTNQSRSHTSLAISRALSRTLALASALALLAVLAAGGLAGAETVVRQVSGTVELGRGEPPVWVPLTVGTPVAPSERIRTGADGRVELTIDAATLRVHENSLLKLPGAEAGSDGVALERGHSLFDVLRRAGRSFEVRTPSVVVSVKGTRFGVESGDGSGIVSVYRGVVGVRPANATDVVEVLVREGFLATGGGDRPIELDLTPEGDPWSDWQALRSLVPPRTPTLPQESEVDRARTSVRRAVDVDVLKRAAERKPEIAERLRDPAGDTKESLLRDLDGKDATSTDSSLPASPGLLEDLDDLEGLEPVEDSQREILDSSRGEEELERMIDEDALVPTAPERLIDAVIDTNTP